MSFTLSEATPEDIPQMMEIWYNAFGHPLMLAAFPRTPAVLDWFTKGITRSMHEEKQHSTFLVMTEEQPDGKRRVASWAKWVVEQPGGPSDWRFRWGGELAEGMEEDAVGKNFFDPMARQHAATTEGRKHYFLEVLATHSDYRKRGLASKMLEWGCEAADRDGLESYLDSSPAGKPLYEKYGYVHRPEKSDSEARSVAMLRPAKKVE